MMKPTAPRITGPRLNPKRSSPMRAPSATAPIRKSRYSLAVMLRPARARSSLRVGLPCTLRRWLRFSAAGFSSRSTSSRGVARAGIGSVAWDMRSLRTLSRAQKKTKIAAAIGTATIVSGGSWITALKQARVVGLDRLECHALGVAYARTLGVGRLLAGSVVVIGLEGVLERGVGQEPRDDLGLALRDHHGQARRARPRGRCLGAHLDHVELREDGLRRHLARRGDRGDDRDIVTGLDVVGDSLLLACRDRQGDVARRDRQVLGLRADGLAGPGDFV